MKLAAALAALVCTLPSAFAQSPLSKDAEALRPMVRTKAAAEWLDRADDVTGSNGRDLPERTIYVRGRPNRALTQAQYDALPEDERDGWRERPVTPETYLSTFYGSPIAYLPALDFAGEAMHATPDDPEPTFAGKKILDLGYGQIGQLEMLAACGAHAIGVDVDPILTLLYDDTLEPREVPNPDGPAGTVQVMQCLWPNDADCRERVGTGYDLILARNLLKRGYVKPTKPIGEYVPVAEGLSDEDACKQFYNALAPGGVLVIYSLGPAPDPEVPWSDIANPWALSAWQAAGFEVVRHDEDVSTPARVMFAALGYGDPDDLETSLFGVCSVYRKPSSE
ncbi:MAG: hypothetical protein R3B49_07520 [Phycisphaerales bacterium]